MSHSCMKLLSFYLSSISQERFAVSKSNTLGSPNNNCLFTLDLHLSGEKIRFK